MPIFSVVGGWGAFSLYPIVLLVRFRFPSGKRRVVIVLGLFSFALKSKNWLKAEQRLSQGIISVQYLYW